ncbi:MAG: hypothetical protein AAF441_16555 [Pseudomonadota bacterium]
MAKLLAISPALPETQGGGKFGMARGGQIILNVFSPRRPRERAFEQRVFRPQFVITGLDPLLSG